MGFAMQICTRIATLLHCRRAVSAVEFALLAPVLVIGTLSTVDAGMAIYEKMMINQVLRAGAQSAIAVRSEADMLSILTAVAGDNFTLAGETPGTGELAVSVASYCTCPDDLTTETGCGSTCTGGSAPWRYYTLGAGKDFSGVFLPGFRLDGTIDVIAQ